MPVVLDDLAESMVVLLGRCRAAKGHHVSTRQKRLSDGADIEAPGVQRLDVRGPARWKYGSRQRSTRAPLPRESGRHEQRIPALVVPENSPPHHRARVPGNVGPTVPVDVILVLPMPTDEQRASPVR